VARHRIATPQALRAELAHAARILSAAMAQLPGKNE